MMSAEEMTSFYSLGAVTSNIQQNIFPLKDYLNPFGGVAHMSLTYFTLRGKNRQKAGCCGTHRNQNVEYVNVHNKETWYLLLFFCPCCQIIIVTSVSCQCQTTLGYASPKAVNYERKFHFMVKELWVVNKRMRLWIWDGFPPSGVGASRSGCQIQNMLERICIPSVHIGVQNNGLVQCSYMEWGLT